MATTRTATRVETRSEEPEDDAPIGELVERAIGGARDLATHEAALVLVELEEDVQAIRRAAVLAIVGAACLSAAVAWAGVALALALSLGAIGLAVFALVFTTLGAIALFLARGRLPSSILGKSRVRVERRIARVTESLR